MRIWIAGSWLGNAKGGSLYYLIKQPWLKVT